MILVWECPKCGKRELAEDIFHAPECGPDPQCSWETMVLMAVKHYRKEDSLTCQKDDRKAIPGYQVFTKEK